MKKAELNKVVQLALPHLQKAGYLPNAIDEKLLEWTTSLVSLYQEQLRFAAEIVPLSEMFFIDNIQYDNEAQEILAEEHVPIVLAAFLKQIEQATEYHPEAIQVLLKNVQKETGYKGKQLFMTIRVALTAHVHGRDLNQTIYLLGKGKVITRLQSLLS